MSEDFKLRLYFNMYKDYPTGSRDNFRYMFRKKHGNFNYLPELILMIERYQKKKYGHTIWSDSYIEYLSLDKKKKGRMF